MASISGICSSSPTLNHQNHSTPKRRRTPLPSLPSRPKPFPPRSLAREAPAQLPAITKPDHAGLEKDPRALWRRYVEWLYQHKELGLYLDVSRVGFTDEFIREMEPRFRAALRAMEDLEKGAIANPDEGRMVGHYWLRDSSRAPTPFLKTQIDNTLEAICSFANDVVSGKVSSISLFVVSCVLNLLLVVWSVIAVWWFAFWQIKPPSSPEGRFTQILSVGIGGSALGPQFVAEALAPDNPPLKVIQSEQLDEWFILGNFPYNWSFNSSLVW